VAVTRDAPGCGIRAAPPCNHTGRKQIGREGRQHAVETAVRLKSTNV